MTGRLRLYDRRVSRLPSVVGACQSDFQTVAGYVNAAQRRLLLAKESGDEGWWGSWAEVEFAVDPSNPVITLPREIARLEKINICNRPVPIHNQFYEYLQFGNGRMPKQKVNCPALLNVYSRNSAVTFRDITNAPQFIRIVISDAQDIGKRVFLGGIDNNNVVVYSQDGVNRVKGVFISLDSPFVTSPMPFNSLTSVQKDVTAGQVEFFQVDPNTGEEILLLTMEPGEQSAFYRRYFLNPIPRNCCPLIPSSCSPSATPMVQVTAMAKLDLIPVTVDTDYCLIQNLEAITEECQSLRYSEMDSPNGKQLSRERHQAAIGLLNGELAHYLGINDPAVEFKPFGSAGLRRSQKIGTLV